MSHCVELCIILKLRSSFLRICPLTKKKNQCLATFWWFCDAGSHIIVESLHCHRKWKKERLVPRSHLRVNKKPSGKRLRARSGTWLSRGSYRVFVPTTGSKWLSRNAHDNLPVSGTCDPITATWTTKCPRRLHNCRETRSIHAPLHFAKIVLRGLYVKMWQLWC